MLELNAINFLAYFFFAWGTNIALNLLYVVGRYFPAFKKIDYPLDLRKDFLGKRLLGDSTTIPGLVITLVLSGPLYFYAGHPWSYVPILVFSGHLFGSFIKRRLGKDGGDFVIFLDHGDYMILLGAVFYLTGLASFWLVFLALIATYVLHPLACWLAFKLGLKARPY